MTEARFGRRIALATAGAILVVPVGSSAYGVWSRAGAGSARAGSGTSAALTLKTTVSGTLSPGGPSRNLLVTVTNANSSAVTVTAISLNGAVTAQGGTGSCTTTGVVVTLPNQVSWSVPAGSGAQFTLTGVVSMSKQSESGCQQASFAVPLRVTGTLP